MYKTDYYISGAFIAVGVAFLAGSLQLGLSAPTSDGIPGSGFFPFILAGLVILLGVAIIAKGVLDKKEKRPAFLLDPDQKGNGFTWLVTILGIFVMLVLWLALSKVESVRQYAFEISVLGFALAMNRFYKRSWGFTLVFSLAIVALIHILFVRVLFISFDI